MNDNSLLLKRLQLLLDVSCNREVVAFFLEMSDFSTQHIRWFISPIIIHKSLWGDTLPSWIFQAIYKDRLEAIFKEKETAPVQLLATPAEVMACIYPASLEAPLNHRFNDVYLWSGNETMTKYNRLPENKAFWEIIGGQPVSYSSIRYDYEELSADIRRKCMKASPKWEKKAQKAQSSQVPKLIQTYLF